MTIRYPAFPIGKAQREAWGRINLAKRVVAPLS